LKEEFEVRVLKQMNNNAMTLFREAINADPELTASAQLYLAQVTY